MLRRSSDGDEEDEVVRWKKLVELGPEKGLREARLSEKNIDKVLNFVDRTALFATDFEEDLSDIEDGMALLLAFYGRTSQGQTCRLFLQALPSAFQMNKTEATALCVNMASNTSITLLIVSGQNVFSTHQKIISLFGNALKTNVTLDELYLIIDLGSEGVRCLADGLRANKNLSKLYLSETPLLDEGIKIVVDGLWSNTSLKSLGLRNTGYGFEGAKLLSSALGHNTTLEELFLGEHGIGRDGFKKLLEPLSWDTTLSSDEPRNTTLKRLMLHGMSRESFCVDSLARMIKVNKTLTCLQFAASLNAEDWTGKIFPALVENKTLRELILTGCGDLDTEEVRSAFISLIKEGKIGSEGIIVRTDDQAWDAQVQEELRINKAYREKLRGESMAAPTSRRIVLCGHEFVGKTTIRNTMARTVQGTPWYHPFKMAYKGAMRAFPHLRQWFFGTDAHKELAERTRGFDIFVFKENPRTSLWDFAGQKEYYALHDYMFPNATNSYFLYVSSCRCPPTGSNPYGEVMTEKKMKDDCSYWLRFIASNSKPNPVEASEGEVPHVKFVLTNIDTLAPKQQVHSKQWAKKVVAELRDQFRSVLELSENVEAVNAHNDADVEGLILGVASELESIVKNQKVYEICEEVQSALDTWSKTDSCKPVVSLEDFQKICQEQKKQLRLDKEVQEGVLAYLNDMGDVIYPKGLDFIVVNPRWFGTKILGYLVDAFEGERDSGRRCSTGDCIFGDSKGPTPPRPPYNGIITREYIQCLLDCSLATMNVKETIGISADQLVQLMILMEMCFEEDPRNKNSRFFLPALFDDKEDQAGRGERTLKWSPLNAKPVYLGRRLECKDESTTFLTPGFFPRLQVHLLLYMQEQKWTENQGFEMGRNLIRFTENGKDICIEYSGNVGYFIDIMVRSSKPYADALQFVEDHVIEKIHLFCASPQGCQGVELVEAVVRPGCVQHLTVCAERKAHSVLVSHLRDKLKEDRGYEYDWKQSVPSMMRSRDFARHLLEGEDSSECSSSAHSAPSVQNLPDFYLKADPGFWINLTQRISVVGRKPFRLHLYCNYEDGSENRHEVEGQPGRTITLPWDSRYNFSILAPAIKFLWSKFGPGISIDKGVDAIFDGGDIPTVDIKMLQRLQNTSETPMETLREYIDCTGGLKQLLKDLNDIKFREDFQLRQFVYSSSGRIGWYCDQHFQAAFAQKEWKK